MEFVACAENGADPTSSARIERDVCCYCKFFVLREVSGY